MTASAVKFRVTGRVQGVWFRAWTQERAMALGLSGWIRNEDDGSVSGIVGGPEAAVEKMLAALREGPDGARVARVETEPAGEVPDGGFRIAR